MSGDYYLVLHLLQVDLPVNVCGDLTVSDSRHSWQSSVNASV